MVDSVFTYAISVFAVSLFMSFTSRMLNRKFVNQEKFAKWQKEINRHNTDKKIAEKTKDKKLLAKVKKQDKRITQMQSKMVKGQMVGFFITMAFFFVMWQMVLPSFFGNETVAYLPFTIPFLTDSVPYPLTIYYWYLFCSFMSTSIMGRIFGTGMGMGMQPQM